MKKSDLQKLAAAMKNKKLSVDQVIELNSSVKIESQKVIDATGDIELTDDYTKTVEQAVADGNYDWKNPSITAKNFPISPEMIGKKIKVSTKLFHFNRDISSEDAISEMDKAGYRPATLMELLVLGFLFPELQRQFPVVALGSVWRDANLYRYVPCLFVSGSERRLGLFRFGGSGWRARCLFLGLRK